MKLLTAAASNTKTAKSDALHGGQYLSYILHLAPSKLSGYNTCAAASKGCAMACLNTAGRGQFTSIQLARIAKTKRLFTQREQFTAELFKDLQAVVRKAARESKQAVVRLNGTSDLPWEKFRFIDTGLNMFEAFPTIQFYDYTAIISRLEYFKANSVPNYHLTFSRKEDNAAACHRAIELGFNVAVVFRANVLPKLWVSRPVIDGDTHDLRFIDLKPVDGRGAVVALKPKGRARKDASGFIIDLNIKPGRLALKVA